MGKRLWLAAAAAGVVAFCAGQAAASTVLYSKAWDPAQAGGYSNQTDFRWADPVSLSADSTVDAVTWYGSSYTGGDLTGVAFDIDFFDDASGLPASTATGHFSGTPTFTDTGSINRYQHEVYLFTLDIDPVVLSANTTYHVSVASHGSAGDTQFIWEFSNLTDGDLSGNGGATWTHGGQAQAFSLIGDVNGSHGPGAPEPAAWALMITGFAGAGAALRRRRALGQA